MAATELRLLLKRRPDFTAAWNTLGAALHEAGDKPGAEEAFAEAARLNPADIATRANLAALRIARGDARGTLDDLRRLTTDAPDFADGWNVLGLAFRATGAQEDAVEAFDRALALRPGDPDILTNQAGAWQLAGRLDKAGQCYQQAIEARPGFGPAYLGLGSALILDGQAAEAKAFLAAAIEAEPGNADAWGNYGNACKAAAEYDEAIEAYRKAIELRPDDAGQWSNWLLMLQYDPAQTPETIWQAHLEFGRKFGEGLKDGEGPRAAAIATAAAPPEEPERPLRIGYMSADFRTHSVAWFLEPLLRHHDRARVAAICYSDVASPDGTTARLKGLADGWRDVAGASDADVAAMIAGDGIDILIDLAGHTAGNRLSLFGRRAAPVQATWLGYPGTTGLAEMDYRFTDDIADPEDMFHSERLVRLPGGFHCYAPPAAAPEPARKPGRPPTFGSFNNLSKVTEDVMACWSALTASVPGARLLLKARPLADPAIRDRYTAIANDAGLPANRLELVGHVKDLAAHLALYAEIDVALDPFPYAGTTTTCEALWMGCPVVTLRGGTHAGRVGASLLTHAGLGELVAGDRGEMERLARALIGDAARLEEYRSGLRGRLAGSSVCDATGFARKVEGACWGMWGRFEIS